MAEKPGSPGGFKEDMIVEEAEPRNWKGILISLLVICSICSLIGLSIILLSPHLGTLVKNERLRLEEVIFDEYTRRKFDGAWVDDEHIVYRDSDGNILKLNADTGWSMFMGTNVTLTPYKIDAYSLSADGRFLMLRHTTRYKASHSFVANYLIYDTSTAHTIPLRAPDDSEDLQLAQWSPKKSCYIIIQKNDIYYYQEPGDPPLRLTSTGRDWIVYNGIPDLMNEEHVLESNEALWWSPNGERLAFLHYDNSKVEQMPYVVYGTSNVTTTRETLTEMQQYPLVVNAPYAKPGMTIPTVTLWVIDLSLGMLIAPNQIIPPKEMQGWDHYITAVKWLSNEKLTVVWSKRTFNYTVISICESTKGWMCEKIIEESLRSHKGWLHVEDAPIFVDDGRYFFVRLPVADGPAGTFKHVAMVMTESSKKFFLTHGQYVVTKLLAYRPDLKTLFFQATLYGQPGKRHLFAVQDIHGSRPREVTCLTCNLSSPCQYYDGLFSSNAKYYILECLGPDLPHYEIREVSGNLLREPLDTNRKLREWSLTRALPNIRFTTVQLPSGYRAQVQLILPPLLVEEEEVKYPTIVTVDARPGGQSVTYQNAIDWSRYLASRKDYVVIHVDVRGSGFQGDKMAHEVHHRLGEMETDDILFVVKYLKQSLKYIDEDQLGVWGREYGGYLTASIMAAGQYFNCGIAIAPVSNFRNYHAAFSEKNMGLPWPQDNYVNYEKTDLIRKISGLKGKSFLLVHGTADHKVHIQHSMLLMKSLTEHGVAYRVQIYPDSDHTLNDVKMHLFRTMEDFFAKCFQLEEDDEESIELPITRVLKGAARIKENLNS